MKAHIGSGTVYLDGWVNVDLPVEGVYLAQDRPDLVEMYRTPESDYYGRHKDPDFSKVRHQEYVCDRYGSWAQLPFLDGDVDELLARQSFEHISLTEADEALREVRRVLKSGGLLRLSVPDHDESFDLLARTGNKFYARHLMGPRKGPGGYHMLSYTLQALRGLVEASGFEFVEVEPNIHDYPAHNVRWRKP